MFGVVPLGKGAVDAQGLERAQLEAAALEARDDLADEALAHAIGLHHDERLLHSSLLSQMGGGGGPAVGRPATTALDPAEGGAALRATPPSAALPSYLNSRPTGCDGAICFSQ